MLYHLSVYLKESSSIFNLFHYATFRCVLSFIISLVIVLALEPFLIRWVAEKAWGQPIRDDGPSTHLVKKGTPTMGGALVVAAVLLCTLLLCDLTNPLVWSFIVVFGVYAGLGFVDDYAKITKQNSKGVSARTKLGWQLGVSAFVVLLLYLFYPYFSSNLLIPYTKNLVIPLGFLIVPFGALVITGCSNAVNLTDGLDGLVIGPVMTVALSLGVIAYVSDHVALAEYLRIANIKGASDFAIIAAGIIGAGIGFLWYNTFPAQVFLGDVGALALGGGLGVMAVACKQELLLPVAGAIFVIEALSVIIQVGYFKMTGNRFFKMAPIHHHFELKGMAEPKIIVRAWIISVVLAILAIASLKIR